MTTTFPLPSRKSFLAEQPWVQTAWDASSLSVFLRCPRRYFYSIICGFRPWGESVDLKFGTLVHVGMEAYHKNMRSLGHTEAQIIGLTAIMVKAWDKTTQAAKDLAEMQGQVAPEGSYWKSHSNNKNLWNALRAFIWHTEQFGLEPDFHTAVYEEEVLTAAGPQKVELPMVEFPFQYDLGFEFYDHPIIFCGHLDRVVDTSAGRWIVDYKTTKNTISSHYFDGYQPSTQLPGYAVASKVVFHKPILGVVVDAFQIGVDFVRCGRGHILTGEEKANEWLDGVVDWIGKALESAAIQHEGADDLAGFAGKNAQHWKMNTESCFLCPFKPVCASTPSIRGHVLQSAYNNEFWDPLARQEKAA